MDMVTTRTAPDSTYKIYDALFALEEDIITPEYSLMTWNQVDYPFETWEKDQTLQTAMSGSVNWYFEALDHEIGRNGIQSYVQKIGYGNENIGSDISSYWMESTLKISPVERHMEAADVLIHSWVWSLPQEQAENRMSRPQFSRARPILRYRYWP